LEEVGDNNKNVWREMRIRCIDTERRNMEANMGEKRLLVYIMTYIIIGKGKYT
jgi:hypothetical protein